MAEQITYYAVVDDRGSRQEPAGVLRRVRGEDGQRDEAFGHNDLRWEHTSLLYSQERGDGDDQTAQTCDQPVLDTVNAPFEPLLHSLHISPQRGSQLLQGPAWSRHWR